jgi:chemotaxis protein CheY-P-specific phosphatase CheC
MTQSELFQSLFPDLLENAVQEVGDLIGESLVLTNVNNTQGPLQEVFSPPRKKFGLTDFNVKEREQDQAHLCFDLDLAVELAGRLIMLPEDEIKAGKKQGKLEGELLDAFSEIANIISGVMNSLCHEALAKHKLHFIKGKLEVYPPKTSDLPLPTGPLTCFSGTLSLGETSLGAVHFLLPHSLIQEAETENAQVASETEAFTETPAPGPQQGAVPEPAPQQESAVAAHSTPEQPPPEPVQTETQEEGLDQAQVEGLLLESLEAAQEELEGLLGGSVELAEQSVQHKKKQELLAKTKGKQILTRIAISGDREGEGFMLLPLRDALTFAGLLLMMPEETITQTVKQGKFDGEVTDAFDEFANILVGCLSNHFKSTFPFKLGLKKLQAEPMVPSQVDVTGDEPFASQSYTRLSAIIQMEGKSYGPLELVFPMPVLGLGDLVQKEAAPAAAQTPAQQPADPPPRQKPDPGQKQDTTPEARQATAQGRTISIIGEDPEQCRMVEESIDREDIDLVKLSLDGDFKEPLARDNLCCVFLLINKVNEQGLAKAIKVRSSLKKDCPLILAGPQWTKSMVFKALKYGATDILITPADRDLIQNKFQKYL